MTQEEFVESLTKEQREFLIKWLASLKGEIKGEIKEETE